MGSNELTIENITQRLANLESQNRRLRRIVVAVAVVATATVFVAWAAPKRTVEAEQFILKDAKGSIRAKLTMAQERTNFVDFEKGGNVTAERGPELTLLDREGTARLTLSVRDDGFRGGEYAQVQISGKGPKAHHWGYSVVVRDDGCPTVRSGL